MNEGHTVTSTSDVDRDRARAFASRARATTTMERSERRGDRLRVVTMYTGAGAVDYGYERDDETNEMRERTRPAAKRMTRRPTTRRREMTRMRRTSD